MFLKIFLSSFFLFPIIYCQSHLEKGISKYNQRHLGCVEDQAKPEPISSAIGHFEKALDKKDDKYEASLYLLKSYYFKSCVLYPSPSPRDISGSRMPSSA